MPAEEGSEWTVVTRQDKRRVMRTAGPRRPRPSAEGVSLSIADDDNEHAIQETLSQCVKELPSTDFFQSFKLHWGDRLSVDQIVCFGIGNLSKSKSASMWQLACALCLGTWMEEDASKTIPIYFYDPCTTPSEANILTQSMVTVLPRNERGKRDMKGSRTLFVMPHCPLQLYENVLWANWFHLENVILFGNSLTAYGHRAMTRLPEGVSSALSFLEEAHVPLSRVDVTQLDGNLEGAFNDCYLTWFEAKGNATSPERPKECLDDDDEDGEVL